MKRLGAEQKALLESATWEYEKQGGQSACLSDYLHGRGLGHGIRYRYHLGIVNTPVLPEHERFSGRMVIPYMTVTGPVDLKFRCMLGHDCKAAKCPKYLCVDGGGNRLYNARAVLAADEGVVITEGEVDAMTVSGVCEIPAVGYPGTESWQNRLNAHWPRLFVGLANVIVIADGDEPGLKAAKAVAKTIENARVVPMPAGHDANSYVQQYGPDDFRERIGWPLQRS